MPSESTLLAASGPGLRVLSHATYASDPLQEVLVHSQPVYVLNGNGQTESTSLLGVSSLREVSRLRVLVSRDRLTLVRA